MFGLSFSEILFLMILALIVIGPKQLPEVARTLGRLLNELRRTTNVLASEWRDSAKVDLQARENPSNAQAQTQSQPQANHQAEVKHSVEDHKSGS